MCRQVLREFCSQVTMPVLLVPADYPQSNLPKDDPNKPGTITEGGVRETVLYYQIVLVRESWTYPESLC
ncbi:hypothetical protein JOM56_007993, partial [Amanita muscaria]